MKRCEDCGARAGEHFSGKDCYTDEQERLRAEARERANECDGTYRCECSRCLRSRAESAELP